MDDTLDTLDFHDAQLLSVFLDPVQRTAEIRLSYYPGAGGAKRTIGTLRFAGVTEVNTMMDMDLLASHASAGNVVQWVSGERAGKSHLFLARGLIAVSAEAVVLVPGA